MVLSRVPAFVGRSLVAAVVGVGLIYASVFVTLSLTARACDARCASLLQKRSAFEAQAAAELQRCERSSQEPCAVADAGIAYDGAMRANERLVAYRRGHRDEEAVIAGLARQKIATPPAR